MSEVPFEVRCQTLWTAADVINDMTWQAEEDFAKLDTAVANVVDGAPGTKTAAAAARFGERWNNQFGKRIDELEAFARKLSQAADNYCGSDQESADEIGQVPGGDNGIPNVPGGGYIPPHSDYGD